MNGGDAVTAADHDIIVIGAGVAGLTAARVAAEGGARVLLMERLGAGGQVSTVDRIGNFPGHPEIGGYELGPLLQDAAEAAGAGMALAEATGLSRSGGLWRVQNDAGEMSANCVILACGSTRKPLGVPGEAAFVGRGVSHCASCDGGFFRGKRVVVVGGGDSALDEALVLAPMVDEVVLVHRGTTFDATQGQETDLQARPNVRTLFQTEVTAVEGDDTGMTGVMLHGASGTQLLPAAGLFVYIGLAPNTGLVEGLVDKDSDGRVMVSDRLESRAAGLFAAGDLRHGTRAMLDGAAADGALAARSALERLHKGKTAGSEEET
ncbi:NAD(P)/FAD-dependent oxidoreductase [Halodurantibacterium flavum]|uniref:Thioredoxin reductase n=1 Tax=Halodurantibacterium flavum TaxID=1382802 RepID=A0ABW4S0U7_9RHOB